MDNVVSINQSKVNTLEFDITTEGLDLSDVVVRFVINAKGMDFSFEAKKKKDDTWSVKIPKMTMLEKTTYDFCIEVVSDGYHFCPMTGKINVVGSAELYSSTPKNITIAPAESKSKVADKKTDEKPAAKKEEKKADDKVADKKVKEDTPVVRSNKTKPLEQIVDELAAKKAGKLTNFVAEKKTTGSSPEQIAAKLLGESKDKPIPNAEKSKMVSESVAQLAKDLMEKKKLRQATKEIKTQTVVDMNSPIEKMARELMEKQDYSKEHIEEKVKEAKKVAAGNKDKEIHAIFEQIGIKTKASTKRPRISIFK